MNYVGWVTTGWGHFIPGVCTDPPPRRLLLAVLGEEGETDAGDDKDDDEQEPHDDRVLADIVCQLRLVQLVHGLGQE